MHEIKGWKAQRPAKIHAQDVLGLSRVASFWSTQNWKSPRILQSKDFVRGIDYENLIPFALHGDSGVLRTDC